jgi:hypothetical protein
MPLRAYCNGGRTKDDKCALEDASARNDALVNYFLYNAYATRRDNPQCREVIQGMVDFSCANENLWFKDGFGNANVCDIDSDSKFRTGQLTNPRTKCQLTTRTYTAVPALYRGGLQPVTESRLKMGGVQPCKDTRCPAPLMERDFDRFVPFVDCMASRVQKVDHIVPKWTWGGEASRLQGRVQCSLRK